MQSLENTNVMLQVGMGWDVLVWTTCSRNSIARDISEDLCIIIVLYSGMDCSLLALIQPDF